jgi:hypothetical protein
MTSQATNSTLKPESTPTENHAETTETIPLNPCQGYKADPITRLHLCNACEYHKYRNETKPWLKKVEE